MTQVASGRSPAWSWLDAKANRQLAQRLQDGLRHARSTGKPALASVTTSVDGGLDPTAAAVASRRPGEPWFCLEQPDRDRSALAAIGCVHVLEARGADRFETVGREWSAVTASALADDFDGPPGSGLVAVGGFAFADDGGDSARWEGFSPASMVVPEVSVARRGDRVALTLNLRIAPDDTIEDLRARLDARLGELRAPALPLLDPAPAGAYRVLSPMPPAHFEEAVARAVQRIRAGELEKIVLARDVEVHAPVDHDVGAVLGLLREAFPSCYVFAVGRDDGTFIAASPELLIRRKASEPRPSAWPDRPDAAPTRRSTITSASSCSTARRTARRTKSWSGGSPRRCDLSRCGSPPRPSPPSSGWPTSSTWRTPIRAQLTSPTRARSSSPALLHPTPAVGGEPWEAARR